MDLGLAGSVALVTGGSRGIGRAVATALKAEGALVAISSRSRELIDATAAEIGASAFVHDSNDVEAAGDLSAAVERELGPIDILIANTGGPPPGADPLAFTREQWQDAHRTLVLTPLELIAHTLPGMRSRGFGRVVAISSVAAREPITDLILSNAHRPGLLAAFKTLARASARDGVTFNSILPGRIATDRVFAHAGSRERAERAAGEGVPAGRLGRPEELAAAVVFLCSRSASYITGTALPVDGGLMHGI